MIDPRIERLMWLEIDRAISPGDRKKLSAYLDDHPEAGEHFESLRRMVSLFDRVGEVNPPADLHGIILQALQAANPPRARRASVGAEARGRPAFGGLRFFGARFLDRVGELFAPRPAWRLAAAGAAGVLIGVIGYHLVRQAPGPSGPLDVAPFYGAMSVNGAGMRSGVGIDVPGVKGTITVRRDESRVLSDLEISSDGEVEVVLLYGGTPLKYASGDLANHSSNAVSVHDREVHVRNRGKGSYHILYALDGESTSPVTVRILSGGSVLFEMGIPPTRVSAKQG